MATNSPNSPRQKMINLMYLVFIAMLAINISSEVLDGFDLVEEGLQQTIKSTTEQNDILNNRMEDLHTQNPIKTEIWFNKASEFKKRSDSLYNHVQSLKVQIVKKSDGENGDVRNIENNRDLNASTEIMLSPLDKKGEKLRKAIDVYRVYAQGFVNDEKKEIIGDRLNTRPSKKALKDNKSWEQALFEHMPTSAAVTLLTKIQTDIKAVEGEVLSELIGSVDADDYRVNNLEALVVPKSMVVMQGGVYEGQIILSAVDSTKRPRFYVGNTLLDDLKNGKFSIPAGAVGSDRTFSGRIELDRPGKTKLEIPFATQYTVTEPMATVAPTLMNVLYGGIPNELSISVPGVANDRVSAQIVNGNGTLTRSGNFWSARPARVGQEVVISVSAKIGDATREVAKKTFKVRALPDPTPYIEYQDANGNAKSFRGGRLAKTFIVSAPGIRAAIDDGLLNIQFAVLRFTINFADGMGNMVKEVSNGGNFSENQKNQIRRLTRGKAFFITDVKVKGPDGIERDITTAMEVRID